MVGSLEGSLVVGRALGFADGNSMISTGDGVIGISVGIPVGFLVRGFLVGSGVGSNVGPCVGSILIVVGSSATCSDSSMDIPTLASVWP
jgi:hypothetical protein